MQLPQLVFKEEVQQPVPPLRGRSGAATDRQQRGRRAFATPLDRFASPRFVNRPPLLRSVNPKAIKRQFARVPTYLPRVRSDYHKFTVAGQRKAQLEAESAALSALGADKAKGRPKQAAKLVVADLDGEGKSEKQLKRDQQLKEDRAEKQRQDDLLAIREAFSVMDEDGGGGVEAFEILKALKALGKKLDDAVFWKRYVDLCGDTTAEMRFERFEALMLERLHRNRKKEEKLMQKGGFAQASGIYAGMSSLSVSLSLVPVLTEEAL